MSPRRIVITGGPGAGKTMLLDELARRGHRYAPESARAIIRERLARGLTPRPKPVEFANEVLRRDIDQYRNVAKPDFTIWDVAEGRGEGRRAEHEDASGLFFFDRSMLDALCMLDQLGVLPAPDRDSFLTEYPYHPKIFLLPPWKEIYRIDSERDQTFAESVRVHDTLRGWYLRCGYEIVTVPPGHVASRCDLVLKTLESGQAPRRPS